MAKRIENVIYILTNPQYPGYVKIGYASDLKQRISSLNTGVFQDFSPYAVYETSLQNADIEIHAIIKLLNPILRASKFDNGKAKGKEFFKLEPEEAFELLKHIARISGTESKAYRVTPDYQPLIPVKVEHGQIDVPPIVSGDGIVPDGTYHMCRKVKRWNNREVEATAIVRNGKWIVQPGSVICPVYGKGDKTVAHIQNVRKSVRIEDNILKEEVTFDAPSTAAGFAIGGPVNGWAYWMTEDGVLIEEFKKKA